MKRPSHIVYTFRSYTDGEGNKKKRWLEIRGAWPKTDGTRGG
jgi:hypothetical protein